MPDPLINRRLGRYHIHQEIGRGGMAHVYRATDTLLQRQVALKILAPQLSNDTEFARRFEREAITAANLRHPAIVTIFDVGEVDGLRYIAMEYVAGRTLDDVLAERGKLGLPLTIGVLQPVAEALEYAHAQGAVHRDVKPHNILIDTDGRVVLTDFGIAINPQAGHERLTQAGTFMGTPEYLSPEQAQARSPDGRSDLYSLGIVAWETLTGRVPFQGATPQLIMAHVYTPPPAISSIDAGLPHELDQIFSRALAKNPAARFTKATAFTEALRSVASRHGMVPAGRQQIAALALPAGSSAGQATIAIHTPAPVAQSAAQPPRPRPVPIGKPSGPPPDNQAPIAKISGAPPAGPSNASPPVRAAGAVSVPRRAPVPAAPQTRRPRPRDMVYPLGERDDIPPLSPEAYAAGRSSGVPWAALAIGITALLLVGLLLFRPHRSTTDVAGQNGNGSLLFGPATVTGTSISPTESPPTPVPTQKPVAVAGANRETSEPQVSTGTPAPTVLNLTSTPRPASTAAATRPASPSPSVTVAATQAQETTDVGRTSVPPPPGGGTDLVFQSGPALNLFDLGVYSAKEISSTAGSIGPATISPDGSTILFDALQDNVRRIFRFDKATGTADAFLQAQGDVYDPAWSADGQMIVYTSTQDGNPEIYRTDATRTQVVRLTNDPVEDDYPSFTPDGKQVVWESRRDKHWQILIASQDELHRLVEPVKGRDDRYPRISPDGTKVVFTSNRDRADGGYELYIQDVAGGVPRRLTTFASGSASGPQWSPDGTMIVFFSNQRGNNGIYLIPANGGTPRAFSSADTDNRWPVWGR